MAGDLSKKKKIYIKNGVGPNLFPSLSNTDTVYVLERDRLLPYDYHII